MLNIRTLIKQLSPNQPCVLCGSMSRDGLWCGHCDTSLPYLKDANCPVCALPTPNGDVCGHCLSRPPTFASTTAAFSYAFPLDKMIHAMKYGQQLALANALASKLAANIKLDIKPDLIIPMPLHPNKLRERGFNQSLLLASSIAKLCKLKLLTDSCQRVRDTPAQSALPWKDRKKNVRDAFHCTMDLTGMNVVLVDDVLTTGASMNALADAIMKNGASRIDVWVVARTLPHSSNS